MRLASERPNDPVLPEDPGPTNDEERAWAERFVVALNEEIPGEVMGLSPDREAFLDRLDTGADKGAGEPERPNILMSSGWKRPRRSEFFI